MRTFCCLLGFFVSIGLCQDPADQPLSAQIVTAASGAHGNVELSVSCANQSTKPITAYVFIVDNLDQNGKLLFRGVHTGMPALDPAHPERAKSPSQRWMETIRTAKLNQPVASRNLSVDYVLFSDGSGWGPGTLKYSLKIEGFKNGFIAGSKSKALKR